MPIIHPLSHAHNHENVYLGLNAQAADSHTVDGAHASATPTADTVPIADINGKLDGWVTGAHYVSDLTPATTFPGMIWVHPNG